MLIADLIDHGEEIEDSLRGLAPADLSRRPLVQWLAEDRTLLARAAHRLARLRRCSVADAEDAVQQAAEAVWTERSRRFRVRTKGQGPKSAEEALAMLVRRATKWFAVDEIRDDPEPRSEWTADAIEAAPDAAGVSLAALRFSPNRAGALLAHLRGEATLKETGEALGGLTRERARQCRDDLVERLRRWYGPGKALARDLHALAARST